MEEVWKDINLESLHDHPPHTPRLILHNNNNSSSQNPSFILQDFLAKDDPPTSGSSLVTTTRGYDTISSGHLLFESSPVAPPPPPPPPQPATALSLYSGPGFGFFDHPDDDPMITLRPLMISPHLSHHMTTSNVVFPCSFGNPFERLDASSALMTSFGRKRAQEPDNSTGDRRHKRMIKNRESAARSRARKQAYTNELELEVQHLMEENTRLRRQQEELRLAADARLPRKRTLHRTSTAPF